MRIANRQSGFTLIELLVVIAIMALLSASIFASLTTSREKARIAKARGFAATTEQVASDELLGRWDFDEGAGTILRDRSGNGLDGTFTGAPTWATDTVSGVGYSLKFSGTTDEVVVLNSPKLMPVNAISFGAWFNTSDLASYTKIISTTEGGGYTLSINDPVSPGKVAGIVRSVGGYIGAGIVTSRVTPGKWHHIFLSYDGQVLNFYYDGDLVDTLQSVGNMVYGAPQPLCIAGEATGGVCAGNNFNGMIDDVRIYGKTLTADQVKSIYAEGARRRMAYANI